MQWHESRLLLNETHAKQGKGVIWHWMWWICTYNPWTLVNMCFCLHDIGHRDMPQSIPKILHLQDDRARKIDPALLPTPSNAVASYVVSGHITVPRPYGVDPLADDDSERDVRQKAFHQRHSFDNIFIQLWMAMAHHLKLLFCSLLAFPLDYLTLVRVSVYVAYSFLTFCLFELLAIVLGILKIV